MERIIVSKEFRFSQTNCNFKMDFNGKIDMRKAYEAMEAAVKAIAQKGGYYPLWLQDLSDCCNTDGFDFESTLGSDEFYHYVPAMCNTVEFGVVTILVQNCQIIKKQQSICDVISAPKASHARSLPTYWRKPILAWVKLKGSPTD